MSYLHANGPGAVSDRTVHFPRVVHTSTLKGKTTRTNSIMSDLMEDVGLGITVFYRVVVHVRTKRVSCLHSTVV